MAYLTPVKLLERMSISALATKLRVRLDSREDIDLDVLSAVIEGSDTSAFTTEALALANAALALIEQAIGTVTLDIDGYVSAVRTLPLTQEIIDASPLPNIAYALVVYALEERPEAKTESEYKAALMRLRDIQKGSIQLGENDPQPSGSLMTAASGASKRIDLSGFGR